MNRDTWDGYPAAREQLLNVMKQSQHANMVVIGGDIHQNWVAKVHADPYDVESAVIATEFTGTSISSRSRGTAAGMRRHLQRNPHLAYANAAYRGYGLVDISAAKVQVTLYAVDAIEQPDSSVSVLAKFEVPSGQPAALKQLL
jgi:alkaline phosphatase D